MGSNRGEGKQKESKKQKKEPTVDASGKKIKKIPAYLR